MNIFFFILTEELTDVSQDGQEVLRELLRRPSCGNTGTLSGKQTTKDVMGEHRGCNWTY